MNLRSEPIPEGEGHFSPDEYIFVHQIEAAEANDIDGAPMGICLILRGTVAGGREVSGVYLLSDTNAVGAIAALSSMIAEKLAKTEVGDEDSGDDD